MIVIRFYKVLFLLFFSVNTFGQSILLAGQVSDETTGEPIPFVNIGALNSNKGTSSNVNGEFVLKIDSLPAEILFSHLNYRRRAIKVNQNAPLQVQLVPVENVLDAITVRGKKRNDYLINLINKAYAKALKSKRNWHGKAYYRQVSKADTTFSELYEIFYDTRFSSNGIEDWEVQEGRYAISDAILTNKNFTLFSRILTTIQPKTRDYVISIDPEMIDYYEYNVTEVKKMGKRQVAIVNFKPLKKLKIPAFEGQVYVDINNYDILKVKGQIQNDKLKLAKVSGDGNWKGYEFSYDLSFREQSDSLVLDYIKIDQSFDYYRGDDFIYPVQTSSQLTFYEYYSPKKKKRLGGKINSRFSDASLLDRIGYDQEFWDTNEIVKRTPVEQNIIQSFEAKKAFGTIYLNNQKQIVLEQTDVLNDSLINEIIVRFNNNMLPQEKAYLHIDKPYYIPGETIWYNAYLLDATTHKAIRDDEVLYVNLIDPTGEIVATQNLLIREGQARGDMLLSDESIGGEYVIRAYTNWMRNVDSGYFFQKKLMIYGDRDGKDKIGDPEKNMSLKFFPEGGDMLEGITSRIGLKALNSDGRALDIEGKIFDHEGTQVSEFKTTHEGMGSFFLLPREGKRYYAKVNDQGIVREFALPLAEKTGFTIKVDNNKSNAIKVTIQASEGFNDKNYYLIGQSRGRIYSRAKGVISKGWSITEIPKAKLPDGIFQITLFDQAGVPRCERLVFIDNERDLDINVSTTQSSYAPRVPVDLNVSIYDAEGYPVKGSFSIAITDAEQLDKNQEEGHIQSYLLLSSDLKGRIEKPGYYFKDRSKETVRNLDMLMLTHGWRRFKWKDMLSPHSRKVSFFKERGLTISGVAVDPVNSTPLPFTNLSVLALGDSGSIAAQIKTDDKGLFKLLNLNLTDSVTMFFNKTENNRVSRVNVLLSDPKYSIPDVRKRRLMNDPVNGEKALAYISLAEERKRIERAFDGERVVMLEEVKIERKKETYSPAIHGTPDATIKPNNQIAYFNIFQMIQGQVAGVSVSRNNIRIRNSNGSPLVLLDGLTISPSGASSFVPVVGESSDDDGGGAAQQSAGLERLLAISPQDVERIEVLKGPGAAIYGMQGANGVIAIYTKRGINNTRDTRPGENQAYSATVQGIYSAREFYSPAYDQDVYVNRPDKRATLYWDAHVKTDNNGQATISFYNSDIAGRMEVDVQGLTDSGKPIHALISIGKVR